MPFKPYTLLPQDLRIALQRLVKLREERDALTEEYERVQQTVVDHMSSLNLTHAGLPSNRHVTLVSTFKLKVVDRAAALQWLLDHGKVLDICNISTGSLNRESRAHPAEYLEFLQHGWVNVTPVQQVRISRSASEARQAEAQVPEERVDRAVGS